MNILLIGDFNSIYMHEYVNFVLLDKNFNHENKYICFHDSPLSIKDVYYNEYKKNNIIIFDLKTKFKLIYRYDFLLKRWRSIRLKYILKNSETIDCLHMHFVKLEYLRNIKKYRNKFKNIIVTFWGSDLLRLQKNKEKEMYELLLISDNIVVGPLNMQEALEKIFGKKFSYKFNYSIFGTPVLEKIKKLKSVNNRKGILEKFDLPIDKYIITCGYNGKSTQQHELILNGISLCDDCIKEKICLVLPMGYGYEKSYFNYIEEKLSKLNIEYIIDENFYDINDIAELRISSDIFIHAQLTDGFSSSVVEYIYADNILINGDWLDYPVLDKYNVYYLKFSDYRQLARVVTDVINNIDEEKNKVRKSNDFLYKIRSWEYVKNEWQKLYNC